MKLSEGDLTKILSQRRSRAPEPKVGCYLPEGMDRGGGRFGGGRFGGGRRGGVGSEEA